jgi:phage FluMu protein Com
MPETKKEIDVRCKMCRRLLIRVTADTSGVVQVHCKKCRMTRTIKLPLTPRAEETSIRSDAEGSASHRIT